MTPMRRLVLSLALAAASPIGVGLVTAAPAWARAEKTLAYPRDQAWATSVRFLRVDEQLKIVEKDSESGYVLFELKSENKTFRGSLEVVAVTEDKRPSLKFVIQIEDRPTYIEGAMLGRLERKLRVELGDPPPPPSTKPRDRDADRDKDKDKDKDNDKAKEAPRDGKDASKDDKKKPPEDPTGIPVLEPREP